MKILFITSRLPYPAYGGDKVRVFNFLKHLSKQHSITLVSFINDTRQVQYIDDLKKICLNVEVIYLPVWRSYLNCLLGFFSFTPLQVYYYFSGKMKAKIKDILKKEEFDGIYVHLLRMAHYVQDKSDICRILDLTDAISLSLKRSLSFRSHVFFLFYYFEWIKVKRYEAMIIKKFDYNLLISVLDKNSHWSLKEAENVKIVANGVDADYFSVNKTGFDNKKIAFLGNFHSFPNRDGVMFFYEKIFPLIRKEIPDIKFYIVGVNPTRKILQLSDNKNVFVTGAVSDIREFLKDVAVLVCPLRVAAGIQNKILEAMAMGICVITTTVGACWLDEDGKKTIVIADKPNEFAEKVVFLIKDESLRNSFAQKGRDFVVKNYDWGSNIRKMAGFYGNCK
ncbi:MAG: glycosyltransferase [Candidatus Omnitrophica bacterium]|nr:glycosyltransferase [Candidatus Omnitrophota bacterium]